MANVDSQKGEGMQVDNEDFVKLREQFSDLKNDVQNQGRQIGMLTNEVDSWKKSQSYELKMLLQTSTANTRALEELKESTDGIVTIYEDLRATVRVGSGARNFLEWLAKMGSIGIGLALAVEWILRNINGPPGPA